MALLYQRRYNKLHKSVYGLSYDTVILNLAKIFVDLYTSVNYKCNNTVINQLYARFPLFYHSWDDIPISIPLLIGAICLFLANLSIWKQLRMYKATSHIHQGVSMTCIVTVSILIGFIATLTLYLWYFNIHHFAYLDHLNSIWVMGNMIGMMTLWPQICINWMGRCCMGISSRYILPLITADCVRIIGYYITLWNNSLKFWQWPYNSIPVIVTLAELLSLLMGFYQTHFVYIGNKPSLSKISEKRTALV